MANLSGKDGKLVAGGSDVADITEWTFHTRSKNFAYASSATGGFKKRAPGVREGEGIIAFVLNRAASQPGAIEEGRTVTLDLYLNEYDFYRVPAVIDSLDLKVDIGTGEAVSGKAKFSTNGPWTPPAYES